MLSARMTPDAGEAVGLQLLPHRQRIGCRRVAAALLRGAHLVRDAEQVLHVVTDFVRDHVSLGELARRVKTFPEVAVERQVDIDLLIRRAVKRPHR
jgi:hypothetical protein